MQETLETSIVSTLDDVDREEWTTLTEGLGLYASYPYLRFAEHFFAERAWYVLCRAGDRLVAALPAYDCAGATTIGLEGLGPYDYRSQFADLAPGRTGGAEWYPGALGGTRTGYVTDVSVDGRLGERARDEAVQRVLARFSAEVRASGGHSEALMYLTPTAAAVVRSAAPDASLLVSPFSADAYLPLHFAGFDEYLSSLPGQRRHTARRERRRFHELGLRITTARLGDHYEEVASLVRNVHHKHGQMDELGALLRWFSLQVEFVDEASVLFLCRDTGGRLVGCSSFFVWNGGLYGRCVGFDYARLPARSYAYFNLVFYEPIRWALDAGLEMIHFGMASAAKAARGSRIRPSWSSVRPSSQRPRAFADSAAGWNMRILSAWRLQYADFASQLSRADWNDPNGGA